MGRLQQVLRQAGAAGTGRAVRAAPAGRHQPHPARQVLQRRAAGDTPALRPPALPGTVEDRSLVAGELPGALGTLPSHRGVPRAVTHTVSLPLGSARPAAGTACSSGRWSVRAARAVGAATGTSRRLSGAATCPSVRVRAVALGVWGPGLVVCPQDMWILFWVAIQALPEGPCVFFRKKSL